MAASFPQNVKSFTVKRDNVDDILAQHINDVQDEIVAIETELKKTTGSVLDSVYLGKTAQAADSAKLGGSLPCAFLGATATAANSAKLGGIVASEYLTTSGKAADADKLDGFDGADYIKFTNMDYCKVRGASQDIVTSTGVMIVFNTALNDTNTMWSSTNPTKVTIKADGYYLIVGGVRFNTNGNGVRSISIVVNGEGTARATQQVAASATDPVVLTVTSLVFLSSGSYLQLQCYQTSGSTINVPSMGEYSPSLAIVRVR
ncbi:MAG: hypothetical protein VB108_01105 [Anaerolineaceae bacterium]|nr:hypothetical protein [Anaerolineaceae bacterium]